MFLPVSLVEGEAQFFLLRLSLPISVALLASLVVAGIFVPLSVYLTLKNGQAPGPARRRYEAAMGLLEKAYDASLGRLNHLYTKLLALFLRRRLDLVMGLAAVFALTVMVAFEKVKVVDTQEEERSGFEIDVRLPQSTTSEEAEEFFRECEKIVEASAEELGLAGWAGVETPAEPWDIESKPGGMAHEIPASCPPSRPSVWRVTTGGSAS